jgi:hypothetical protein
MLIRFTKGFLWGVYSVSIFKLLFTQPSLTGIIIWFVMGVLSGLIAINLES